MIDRLTEWLLRKSIHTRIEKEMENELDPETPKKGTILTN